MGENCYRDICLRGKMTMGEKTFKNTSIMSTSMDKLFDDVECHKKNDLMSDVKNCVIN